MDPHRFDALVRQLTGAPHPRRSILRLTSAALASLLVLAGIGQQAAAACKQNQRPCTA